MGVCESEWWADPWAVMHVSNCDEHAIVRFVPPPPYHTQTKSWVRLKWTSISASLPHTGCSTK